jgi:hypothetical protein
MRSFGDPPVLRTERLVLWQITESGGEGLFGIFADGEVTEFYAWDRFTDVGQGHELAASPAPTGLGDAGASTSARSG